jgi:dipeptidase E
MSKSPQIIAMGGGGFLMEPDNLSLDRYVLSATGAERPKICFVPTASGDAQTFIDRFYSSFNTLPCIPTHLSLFKPPKADLRSFVLEQDAVYVGGGNTRALMVLWREWGLDEILRDAWQSGVVMAGLSAGSLCWFEEGVSDSVLPDQLLPIRCNGFLKGSHCPHYDGEPGRRPAYHRFIQDGTLSAGYAADDGAALHFLGEEPWKAVSSRPAAKVYRVSWNGEQIEEIALETEFLAGSKAAPAN